jgi:hypothetical protein
MQKNMLSPFLVLLVALACCASEKDVQVEPERKLTPAELHHKRHNGVGFWRIGEGFEGSASDWTEYVVWLFGVCGVFYYMANPNARRNLHAIEDDESTAERFDRGEHHDELFVEGDAADDGDEREEQSPASERKKER